MFSCTGNWFHKINYVIFHKFSYSLKFNIQSDQVLQCEILRSSEKSECHHVMREIILTISIFIFTEIIF